MGVYLNPGNTRFRMCINSEIFVDKTEMIAYLNNVVNTNQRFISVSRPRRFGKTMAADMICAYYDRSEDSRPLFEKTKLGKMISPEYDQAWDTNLGKYDVIRLVMTDFFSKEQPVDEAINTIKRRILDELAEETETPIADVKDFHFNFDKLYSKTGKQFVIVIDEWDAVFRERKEDKEGQKKYLDFLRDWLKDKEYIALAYMTGILPIKKYGKHSALNMFDEYSMTQPMRLASFTGFTEGEVKGLCDEYEMDYDEVSGWYDGYRVSDRIPVNKRKLFRQGEYEEHKLHIYSPLSVVNAMRSGELNNYWNETESYEALKQYVDMNFDGLREDVAILMDGRNVPVDITGYQNDMTTFHSKDDILTMFIHLGYLGYDRDTKEVFVPNSEVMDVFKSSTKSGDWAVTFAALANSEKLLKATWTGDEETVSELIEAAHNRAGNRDYNSEAALSYAVRLAYYRAQDYYTILPELDTGKGYADLVFIPKRSDIPALLVELKYDADADTAIAQILRQKYPDRLELYKGNIILVGINYDKEAKNDSISFKHHSCRIGRA